MRIRLSEVEDLAGRDAMMQLHVLRLQARLWDSLQHSGRVAQTEPSIL